MTRTADHAGRGGEDAVVLTSACCDAIHAKDVSVDEGYSVSQNADVLVIRIARQGEVRLTITAAGKLHTDLGNMLALLDARDPDDSGRQLQDGATR